MNPLLLFIMVFMAMGLAFGIFSVLYTRHKYKDKRD